MRRASEKISQPRLRRGRNLQAPAGTGLSLDRRNGRMQLGHFDARIIHPKNDVHRAALTFRPRLRAPARAALGYPAFRREPTKSCRLRDQAFRQPDRERPGKQFCFRHKLMHIGLATFVIRQRPIQPGWFSRYILTTSSAPPTAHTLP